MATFHVLAVVTVLVAAGFLPAWALVRDARLAVAAGPLVTALVCSTAAMGALVTGIPITAWLALAFLPVWASSFALLLRRRSPAEAREGLGWTTLLVFLGVVAVPLLAVRRAPIDWDARSIWFFHADWLWAGGRTAADAFANSSLAFSHPDYPPLAPATVAALWRLLGRDYEVAQLVIGVLTASAVVTLAAVSTRVVGRASRPAAGVLGVALILAAYGLAGPGGTNGYVDLLWAASFAAGAVTLLLAPPSMSAAGVGAICVATAMLTKNEGMVAGLILLALVALRAGWRRGILFGVGPVVLSVAWVLTSRALGAQSDLVEQGRLSALISLDLDVLDRAGPALAAFWRTSSWELGVAALVTFAGVLAAGRLRRQITASAPLWLWAVTAGCFASFLFAYMISPNEINWHLQTSVGRTTIAPRLLLLVDIIVWMAALVACWSDRPWGPALRTGAGAMEPTGHGAREASASVAVASSISLSGSEGVES